MTTASSRARAFMWRRTASSRRCDSKPAGFGTKAIRRMPWGAIKGLPSLRCAVNVARDHLSVPMDEFRHVGVVVDINTNPLALLQPDQRARVLDVVERRRDDMLGRQFGNRFGYFAMCFTLSDWISISNVGRPPGECWAAVAAAGNSQCRYAIEPRLRCLEFGGER